MTNRTAKQQKILLAAAELFMKKGYEKTTIEDITNAVEINKAMLYYYFPDKQTVLYNIMNHSIHLILRQSRAIVRLKVSPKEKLELLIQNHLARFTNQKAIPFVSQTELRSLSPELLKKYIKDRDCYEKIVRSIIKDGIDVGEFKNMDVNLASSFILGLLNSVILWYRKDGHYSIKEIGAQLIALLSFGMPT